MNILLFCSRNLQNSRERERVRERWIGLREIDKRERKRERERVVDKRKRKV